MLAMTGMTGHMIAVGLLVAAGCAFGVSLIVRPPADVRAAAWRIALGLTVMFTLSPATRWGYFVYPIGLAFWLQLTRPLPAGALAQAPDRTGTLALDIPAQAGERSMSMPVR
jgi:hypothetical protein